MESYTVSIKHGIGECFLINILQNNIDVVEFEFKNTVSAEKWKSFVNDVISNNIEELSCENKHETVRFSTDSEYFSIVVCEKYYTYGYLNVMLKKNQSLLDALTKIASLVQEN